MKNVKRSIVITEEQDRYIIERGQREDRPYSYIVRVAIDRLRDTGDFFLTESPTGSGRNDYNHGCIDGVRA